VQEFRDGFAAHAASVLQPEDFEPVQRIDACIELRHIDGRFWKALTSLEPFGLGNPSPVFAVADVEIANEPSLMKEKHVRFAAAQNGRVVSFKAFNMGHRVHELQRGTRVDVAFRLEADDYRGGWSASVCDFRPAATKLLE
jgi:single-stranded-DNA-specific exonuclease